MRMHKKVSSIKYSHVKKTKNDRPKTSRIQLSIRTQAEMRWEYENGRYVWSIYMYFIFFHI